MDKAVCIDCLCGPECTYRNQGDFPTCFVEVAVLTQRQKDSIDFNSLLKVRDQIKNLSSVGLLAPLEEIADTIDEVERLLNVDTESITPRIKHYWSVLDKKG